MEYLDLCRMREVGYTSTKPHFANSWVRKPLKYTYFSVYMRYAFRISTWSLSRGLCFQVRNSWHSLFFSGSYQTALNCCERPLLDWGWIACIRCKASCTEPRGLYSDGSVRMHVLCHPKKKTYIYISGGPLSTLTCCVNVIGAKKNIAVNLFSKLGWELGLYYASYDDFHPDILARMYT